MMSTRSRFLSEDDAREEARHYVFIFFYVLGFALLVPFSPDGTFLGPREQSITALASLPRENEAVDLQWEEMKLWDNLDRRVRFPSKEQRLKIYMGHWYEQCGPRIRFQQVNATHVVVEEPSGRKLELSNYPDTDGTFWVEPSQMDACANSTWRLHFYCKDAANLTKAERPLLLQFGDARDSRQFGQLEVPHIKKSRPRMNVFGGCPDVERKEAIIWRLNVIRHFGKLFMIDESDIPWSKKKPMVVFRGDLTGIEQDGLTHENSEYTNCMLSRRCRLVYRSGKSEVIDAKLTTLEGFFNETINGTPVLGKQVHVREQIRYKGIVMMEGNDVSSGLKWALYSTSVVFMPPPQQSTWAMEELLEPWVHYVPLDADLSNLEEQMQWVLANDAKAEKIGRRGRDWIFDMVYDEQAEPDNDWLEREMMLLYSTHFVESRELIISVSQ